MSVLGLRELLTRFIEVLSVTTDTPFTYRKKAIWLSVDGAGNMVSGANSHDLATAFQSGLQSELNENTAT